MNIIIIIICTNVKSNILNGKTGDYRQIGWYQTYNCGKLSYIFTIAWFLFIKFINAFTRDEWQVICVTSYHKRGVKIM